MAKCGWCRQTDLQNNKGVDGLEEHRIPGSNKWCEGQATSPDYTRRITVKQQLRSAVA